MEKSWMLFDDRYITNEDKAVCFECCETLKEAKKNAKDYGNNTVIVEYLTSGNQIKKKTIVN